MRPANLSAVAVILCVVGCGYGPGAGLGLSNPIASGLRFEDPYTLVSEKNFLRDYPPQNSDGTLNAVIENPLGTNEKWEVKRDTEILSWDLKDGKPRVVQYLPYPWNYGMIPQSKLSKRLGGDDDPLDVVVLGPAFPRGAVVPVKVLGVMRATDAGEIDDKIIAVSIGHPLAQVADVAELQQRFPGVTDIISIWFANYKGKGKMKIAHFEGPEQAMELVRSSIESFAKNG